MNIQILRQKSNQLYTEGELLVNGSACIPYTVEHTFTMLLTGEYRIRITRNSHQERALGIFPVDSNDNSRPIAFLEVGHSFLAVKNCRSIVLGEKLVPGSAKNGHKHYNRLFDRLEKCEQRNEEIMLIISDVNCQLSSVSPIWTK